MSGLFVGCFGLGMVELRFCFFLSFLLPVCFCECESNPSWRRSLTWKLGSDFPRYVVMGPARGGGDLCRCPLASDGGVQLQ